jgi:hypothetical protein
MGILSIAIILQNPSLDPISPATTTSVASNQDFNSTIPNDGLKDA